MEGRRAQAEGRLLKPVHETAIALTNAGRATVAASLLKGALERDSNDPDCWVALGYANVHLTRLKEAVACFQRAVELNPFDTFAWGLQASPLDLLGRKQEAQHAHEMALMLEKWRGGDPKRN